MAKAFSTAVHFLRLTPHLRVVPTPGQLQAEIDAFAADLTAAERLPAV